MNNYERLAIRQLMDWKRKINKPSGMFKRISKAAQTKINQIIPEKVHHIVTESIKTLIKTTLLGSEFTTKKRIDRNLTFQEKEQIVMETLNTYKKIAAAEGAGTGAGGIFLGLADFPLLLSIKMKFLFETATIYGFDVKNYEERLYILHIFQLAFSGDEHRKRVLDLIENWDECKNELKELDWRVFQQEYRDYIDLVKMLQLVPGVGAVVGAYANYHLLDHLGECAMNAYRLRILNL